MFRPETLRGGHIGAAVLHGLIALSVLVVFALPQFKDRGAVPVSRTTGTRAQRDKAMVYEVGTAPIGTLRLPWLLAAFAAVTCGAHVLNAVRGTNVDGAGANPVRWAEYAVSAPIMLVIIAALSGVRTVSTLVLMATATCVTMYFGWLTERSLASKGGGGSDSWLHQGAGWVLYVPVWVMLGFTFFSHLNDAREENPDDKGPPAWLWAIFVSQLIFFSSFGALQLGQVSFGWSQSSVEGTYMALSFAAKATLAGLMFAGLTAAPN